MITSLICLESRTPLCCVVHGKVYASIHQPQCFLFGMLIMVIMVLVVMSDGDDDDNILCSFCLFFFQLLEIRLPRKFIETCMV